jgi:hypothetical protein
MAKSLAIRHGESTGRSVQPENEYADMVEVAHRSSTVPGFHFPSARFCAKIGFWLINLSLGAGMVYICLRYWLVPVVALLILVAMFVCACFLDDSGSKEDLPPT